MTQALGLRILHHKPKVAEGTRKIGLMCATWHAKKLKEQHITHITWMERHRKKRFETLTAHFWGGMPANCLWQLLRCCANKIKTDYHIIFNELSGTQLPSYPARSRTQRNARNRSMHIILLIRHVIQFTYNVNEQNVDSEPRRVEMRWGGMRWDELGPEELW